MNPWRGWRKTSTQMISTSSSYCTRQFTELGTSGRYPGWRGVEDFLDRNPDQNIRAIFTGHDHVFAAFKRKNVYLFVNGVGGGALDPPYRYG